MNPYYRNKIVAVEFVVSKNAIVYANGEIFVFFLLIKLDSEMNKLNR